jgi:hypothetical protein
MGFGSMKQFFSPNIDFKGRIVRGVMAFGAFAAAGFLTTAPIWVKILLAVYGLFAFFEALRGWCVLRACGIKTKL